MEEAISIAFIPASESLTEERFMKRPLELVRGGQALQWNSGTPLPIRGTLADRDTLPSGSTWKMEPNPSDRPRLQEFGAAKRSHRLQRGTWCAAPTGPACRQLDPPCPQDSGWHARPPASASVDAEGDYLGDWTGGVIVDRETGVAPTDDGFTVLQRHPKDGPTLLSCPENRPFKDSAPIPKASAHLARDLDFGLPMQRDNPRATLVSWHWSLRCSPPAARMIASGELFLLNGETLGQLRLLPAFLNKSICVLATGTDRIYVACEPPVPPQEVPRQPCAVWCLRGDSLEPELCQDFEAIDGSLREIAIGDQHVLALTREGTVWSRGTAVYGNTGHGGATDVEEFRPLAALQGRSVRAISKRGETGLVEQVESVPRFVPTVTKFRVAKVSCGNAHVLAVTESQQCISWGENTCGQLGIGRKSKPTHRPQLLDSIPSQIREVSAGWAHSVAVGTDGRVYSWGLNSHGQLGLGDVAARLAPHLLQDLVDVHQVESAHAARTLTAFLSTEKRPLLCGQIPFRVGTKHSARSESGPRSVNGTTPRRPGSMDPDQCVLAPVPLTIAAPDLSGVRSQLSQLLAYDRGVVAFARSAVHKVEPNLAPLKGGTPVRVHVNGLPYFPPARTHAVDSTTTSEMAADAIPVREFTTPNVVDSPLVDPEATFAVQVRVSVDDGFTWTPDRYPILSASAPAPPPAPPSRAPAPRRRKPADGAKPTDSALQLGLQGLMGDSKPVQADAPLLWYSWRPKDGPTHVEPRCVPVAGGSELLLHVDLPPQLSAEQLAVKFVCTPRQSVGGPAGRAPSRPPLAETVGPDHDAVAELPPAMPLEVQVAAWLDAGGHGVRVVSPPLDAESIGLYDFSVELSLDGRTYLPRALPLSVYDLRVTALEPNTGSLLEQTQVKVRGAGLVPSDVHRVRLDFPQELGWKRRQLPASLDLTTGEVSFTMPDLAAEVRERADAALGAGRVEPQVSVELSLNGQNFTRDGVPFTFHGPLRPAAVCLLALPEGYVAEEPPDPKAKGKKAAPEEAEPRPLPPAAKLGCAVEGLCPAGDAAAPSFAVLRADLLVRAAAPAEQGKKAKGKAAEPEDEEEPVLLRVVDLPALVETITPKAPSPPPPDPKDKNPQAPPEPEPLTPVEMITALTPAIRSEELPAAGCTLLLANFQVSLNGQAFVPCPVGDGASGMRLEPLPPEQ
ncbi:unnamed protein product [Prorocentrum cordatum]|uniref:Uncharacterized protein n=1 Tax=Prorocentrum cordatum TaxID=2364126 RepID=A0ABN9VKE9_9DINO|nr:unnamed protein product [Polarella glacialis]